jgi:HK97 gp10 family phage protein
MGSFSIKHGELDKIISAMLIKEPAIIDGIERKMNLIVDVVFKTASARRPKVSAASGAKKGAYRVSDPNAKLGVPVDTGALQTSITKSVKREGKKIIGEVDSGLGLAYAKMIEFGTSRMAARPFMRPAWNENVEWIKNKWKEKITKI